MRLRTFTDPDFLPSLDTRHALRPEIFRPAQFEHRPRILLLYGSLRERSYSRLVTEEAARLVQFFGGEPRILVPFEDALKGTPLEGHYSPRKESLRQLVNEWIRHSGAFDAVVDFDRLARDGARPTRLRAEFDSGDHLHPGDAGYRAMADSIELRDLLGPSRE